MTHPLIGMIHHLQVTKRTKPDIGDHADASNTITEHYQRTRPAGVYSTNTPASASKRTVDKGSLKVSVSSYTIAKQAGIKIMRSKRNSVAYVSMMPNYRKRAGAILSLVALLASTFAAGISAQSMKMS